MPNNDLERAFGALSDDTARQARLAPAAAVRKRADRQTLTRSVTGVAAAVVLVAGVLVGSRLVLTDNALPPLPPAQSSSPTSAPSSVTPSPSGSTPSSPPASVDAAGPGAEETETPLIPKSIPIRAFLKRSETNAANLQRLGTPSKPLKLCTGAADFDSEDRVGVRGTIEIMVAGNTVPAELYQDEDEGKDPDIDYFPVALISNSVTVYRAGGAEDYLDEFRAMAKDCPKGKNGAVYRSLGPLGLGDESLLIQQSVPATNSEGDVLADGSRRYSYFAEVRMADTVVTVHYGGYLEGSSIETVKRDDAESITAKAVKRARNWRS